MSPVSLSTPASESSSAPTADAPPTEGRADGPELHPGLAGVYLSTTRTSRVDGEKGSLVIGGFPLERWALDATFEETVLLLWIEQVPGPDAVAALRSELRPHRRLSPLTLDILRRAAASGASPMDALRAAVASFGVEAASSTEAGSPFQSESLSLLAGLPSAVAAFQRLRQGLEPVEPGDEDPESLAASFLHRLRGRAPDGAEIRALDTYLNTVVDHGANASTFTARVIVSTGANLVSAVVGAIGALSGPLHGGAPGPALEQVLEIARPERAEAYLRAKLEAGERLMGFGHRVYKVRDPRAEVLSQAARRLFSARAVDENGHGDGDLYALAKHVETVAVGLLDEHKPGRRLRTNVEYYTALLLHGLDLPTDLFTPVFAMSRTAGWIAHAREQQRDGKLIRPRLLYEGPTDRRR